ncbi:ROK family protein [Solwaraspora sp. WMMD937]|uniref:ROK family protein n=1 Tax=Solwaraspora sp. WMMD937 TaxID=3016090 RepID=UPI00249C5D7D|nr:ROK family protein [Solwaraspora sp. WMMD937]WFE23575.1 ROK family protein [Solwaraspora sp. WMMD937]
MAEAMAGTDDPVTIGVDIGGTKIAAALVGVDGAVGPLRRVPTPAAEGAAAVLAAAVDLARQVGRDAAGTPVACGVGTAGAVDPAGRVTHATDTLPGWRGTDVRAAFTAALGLSVVVCNDVHAMAAGEAWCGAAADARDALVVAAGTGIGGAIVVGGDVVVGRHGFAGSVGHLPAARHLGRRCGCGAVDHVEAYAAGPAIAAEYAARTGRGAAPPLEEVAAAAAGGDPVAVEVTELAAQVLGEGLATAANLLDPEVVVLGGGVVGLGDRFVAGVRAALHAAALPGIDRLPVRTARLGNAAVLAGAALLAGRVLTGRISAGRGR